MRYKQKLIFVYRGIDIFDSYSHVVWSKERGRRVGEMYYFRKLFRYTYITRSLSTRLYNIII